MKYEEAKMQIVCFEGDVFADKVNVSSGGTGDSGNFSEFLDNDD